MKITKKKLAKLLANKRYPRSANYDPAWVLENEMGPNALWLTEELCRHMDLKPGMRVLDMGCGKAMSSIFLAKEYGVQVWANDLWIEANYNWQQVKQAGLQDRIFPIHAEARNLPYADEFFDAIVSIDSYFYYGTDDLYFQHFAKLVRQGGQIGIIMPGFARELDGSLPKHLEPFWDQDCWGWHTAEWWRNHWQRTGLVEIELAEIVEGGLESWKQFYQAKHAVNPRKEIEWDLKVLNADKGRYICFIQMVARRK